MDHWEDIDMPEDDDEYEEDLVDYCAECGNPIFEGDEYETTEDGQILCEGCHEDLYAECDVCGAMVPRDEMILRGTDLVCRNCAMDA